MRPVQRPYVAGMLRTLLSISLAAALIAGCTDPDSGSDPSAGDIGSDSNAVGDGTTGSDEGQTDGGPEGDAPITDGGTGGDGGQADGGGSDTALPGGQLIRIVTTSVDDGASQSLQVRVEPTPESGFTEVVLDSLTVTANGQYLMRDFKIPTEFVLDTFSYPDGMLTLAAEAVAPDFAGTDTIDVAIANSPLRIDEVTPNVREVANGGTLEVVVRTSLDGATISADFSALDSGFDAASLVSESLGANAVKLSYTLSGANTVADGAYPIPVTATLDGATKSVDELIVRLQNAELVPFRVQSGLFVNEPLPAPDPQWFGSPIELTAAGTTILTGGSADVEVDFTSQPNPGAVVGLIVGMEGANGYYHVPLDGSNGVEALQLLMRSYADNEVPPLVLQTRVALRDVAGRVSPYAPASFDVLPVGTGDIQVSLSWDTATDVDLHVIEPGGCELYYGNKTCSSGGELDLDSNAGCGIDGINNENAYWPPGAAPEGEYQVRVAFWSDCSGLPADYTVTVNYCGNVEVYTGAFAAGTDTGGGAGSGIDVATFSNVDCGSSIKGQARFQDRTFDQTGFKASTYRPIRHAVVELERMSDGEIVATTTTDRYGRYELFYGGAPDEELRVLVWSKTDPTDGLRDIIVADHPKFKATYQAVSAPFMHTPDTERILDMDVDEANWAGAFNVFDVILDGHDLIRRMTGKKLGEIRAFWKTEFDTTDTLYCSDYLYTYNVCTELGALSVQGREIDRDEYDDMVILEEFFKMVLDTLAADDHPGDQDYGVRGDPTRSWTEGAAAFFATDVLDTGYHINGQPQGVYQVLDLENMDSPFSFGVGLFPQGAVSEYMVSAFLWDLRDSGGFEVFDAVHGKRGGIYDTIFNYLASPQNADRGVAGVDLTDVLDGWFCRGWGAQSAVTDLLVTHRQFEYDFAGPDNCTP